MLSFQRSFRVRLYVFLLKILFQSCGQLVWAAGRFVAAANPTQTSTHLIGWHTFHQLTDALSVSMASANELYVLHHTLVVYVDVYLT